jgi:hypothetical protein
VEGNETRARPDGEEVRCRFEGKAGRRERTQKKQGWKGTIISNATRIGKTNRVALCSVEPSRTNGNGSLRRGSQVIYLHAGSSREIELPPVGHSSVLAYLSVGLIADEAFGIGLPVAQQGGRRSRIGLVAAGQHGTEQDW